MTQPFNLKRATIKLIDGASVPHVLSIIMAEGNLTFSEKKDRKYLLDRGNLNTVQDGDDQPMEVSFEGRWLFLRGDSDVTIEDFLKKRGGASSYTSSDPDACAPYAVDLQLEYTPLCTSQKIETIVFPDFRYESLDHDAKAATISCKGKCNATEATVTRTDNT